MARSARTGRARERLRGLAVDFRPLRTSRDYRLLWWGELVSETGRQVTVVAILIQVFDLTGSPAAVGLVGLAQLVPLVVMSLAGQSIVDAVDRRKLLIVTQLGYAATSTVLLLGAALGPPPVALVYAMAGVAAGLSAIDNPTRSAMVPRLVGREQLPAAIALNQVMWNTTIIVGPAVGGVVIARVGLEWAYAIDVVTYAATVGAALLMRPMPPDDDARATRGVAAVRRGPGVPAGPAGAPVHVRRRPGRHGLRDAPCPVPDAGGQPVRRGPRVVGGLFSAIAVGALLGALTSGWVGGVVRQGRAVVAAVVVWGAGIAAFGLVGDRLWLAFAFLALAGGADVVSAVFRSTILQLSVPDSLRGRLSSIHILVVTGGPKLGDVEAGAMASLFGPTVSVVSGGVACMAGALLLAVLVPEFDRYRATGSEGGRAVGEGVVGEHGVGPGEGAAHALVDPPGPGEAA